MHEITVAQINRIRIDARRQLQEENICGSPSSFIEVVSKLTEVKTNMKTIERLWFRARGFWGYGSALRTLRNQQAPLTRSSYMRAVFYPKTAIVARL
jgi:hypothetical protein